MINMFDPYPYNKVQSLALSCMSPASPSNLQEYSTNIINTTIFIPYFLFTLYHCMSFLDEIWVTLAEKKKLQQSQSPPVQFKQIYKGYRTIPIQKLNRERPNSPNKNAMGIDQWKKTEKTHIYTYMENAPFTNYSDNGFFTSFYKAYMGHADLKIKPDEIWMTIMLWFTKYVDDNAEQLRTAFVTHAGKKELVVQTDRNLYDWKPFLNGVIQKIKDNTIKGVVEKLQCDFTSTALFEKMFSTALIMNTCKKYFDYTRAGGGCGIVNVHMAGTLEDWEKLQWKLANLEQFDVNGKLKKYIRGLKPVLQQFTETFKGNAHLQFWNNLYFQRKVPNAREYMPSSFINGWLIKFFTTSDEITDVQELESFSVDIKYIDLVTKEVTYFNLNGGCKGYSCIDDYVYTPHYSFAIVLDEKKMKSLSKQAKQLKQMEKHKERIMRKNLQSTPIANKKIVTLSFNQTKNNHEMPIPAFNSSKKTQTKQIKNPLQQIGPFPIASKVLTVNSIHRKIEEKKK